MSSEPERATRRDPDDSVTTHVYDAGGRLIRVEDGWGQTYHYDNDGQTQDPLGLTAGDSNVYRYVENQATLDLDPSGLNFIAIGSERLGGVSGSNDVTPVIKSFPNSWGHLSLLYYNTPFIPVGKVYDRAEIRKCTGADMKAGIEQSIDEHVDHGDTKGEWLVWSYQLRPTVNDPDHRVWVYTHSSVAWIGFNSTNADKEIPILVGKDAKTNKGIDSIWQQMINLAKSYKYAEHGNKWKNDPTGKSFTNWPRSHYHMGKAVFEQPRQNNSNTFIKWVLTDLGIDYTSYLDAIQTATGRTHPGNDFPSVTDPYQKAFLDNVFKTHGPVYSTQPMPAKPPAAPRQGVDY